jgi:hypothetical protein
MVETGDTVVELAAVGALVEEARGEEDARLTRHQSIALRRVSTAARSDLVRVERALTSTVDLPLVSGPQATIRKLGTSIDKGLSPAEAEARLAQYGPNELEKSRDPSVVELILLQVRGAARWCPDD